MPFILSSVIIAIYWITLQSPFLCSDSEILVMRKHSLHVSMFISDKWDLGIDSWFCSYIWTNTLILILIDHSTLIPNIPYTVSLYIIVQIWGNCFVLFVLLCQGASSILNFFKSGTLSCSLGNHETELAETLLPLGIFFILFTCVEQIEVSHLDQKVCSPIIRA